jgi:hypothetical protein
MRVLVPDPGFAPLLAIHFAARALADDSLDEERGALFRALVPVAASNPTALDTLLSYRMTRKCLKISSEKLGLWSSVTSLPRWRRSGRMRRCLRRKGAPQS